jgi:hypothetical protein
VSQAADRAGLIADFARLASRGSGDDVLDTCATLMSLPPVARAVDKDVLGSVAARTLLDLVARRASNSRNVRAAAALTGIDPSDTSRGVRGDGSERQESASVILYVSERTVRKHRHRYFEEYAAAVLAFLGDVAQDDQLLEAYLLRCGVSIQPSADDEQTDRLAGILTPVPPVQAIQPSLPNHLSPMVATPADDSIRVRLARTIPISGLVGQALEAARTSCEARRRAFYTSDLVLALLDMPNSRAAECFEETQAGLAQQVRNWLSPSHSAVSQAHPFQPFEWTERPDVQLAQDLALMDGAAAVTEVYLLLGVLGSQSSTRERLAALLVPSSDRLLAVANTKRRQPAPVLRTPGPGHGAGGTDRPTQELPVAREMETP